MKKLLFVLASIGFVVYSCKKDNNKSSSSNTQLITSATWKYDTVAIDRDKDGKADFQIPSGYLQACDLDNKITFKADSTGILDEGATKCSSTDPQTATFKWWFKENETILYSPDPIFTGLSSGDTKISVLTSTKLELIKELSVPPFPGTVNVILDLKH